MIDLCAFLNLDVLNLRVTVTQKLLFRPWKEWQLVMWEEVKLFLDLSWPILKLPRACRDYFFFFLLAVRIITPIKQLYHRKSDRLSRSSVMK